ncbi:protein tipE-like [Panulirus ornatus]|uniref:protein tipE-like n=1 Tax=Panulirus ornatus TaxID=150431 RepID=UPI003A87CB6D
MADAEEEQSFGAKLKYYITLTLGTTACISSFVFMFMIPWVLDPSISTLMANFDPKPVVCKTIQSDHLYGTVNCSWSSCKHGCTTDIYECDQIYINYMDVPFVEYEGQEIDDDDDIWVGRGIPLFINIKACGYPPGTNCSIFSDIYSPEGSVYPCYYSRADPNMVITDYDRDTEVQNIIMALLIPNLLCGKCDYWIEGLLDRVEDEIIFASNHRMNIPGWSCLQERNTDDQHQKTIQD